MNSTNNPDGPNVADARAALAGLDVDTQPGVNTDGRPGIRMDRAGLEKLRDMASAHGAFTIAACVMTFEESADRHDQLRCGAKKRQGEGTCAQPAGWGTDHAGTGRCKLHGGATKSQSVGAERVRVEREARLLLAELGEVRPVTDPAAELQRVAGEIVAMKDAAARIVQGLSSMRYVGATGAEQLRAEVAVYERSLDRAARVLADMVKLGLEARQVGLAEEQGLDVMDVAGSWVQSRP